jgi:hypothetical protein
MAIIDEQFQQDLWTFVPKLNKNQTKLRGFSPQAN